MLVCKKCSIEYEEGKKFCRNCGSPLVVKEEPSSTLQDKVLDKEESPKAIRICPRCKVSYESGKYCRKCGSVLVEQVPFQEKEKVISAPQPELKVELPQIQAPEKELVEHPEGKLICPNCKIFHDAGKFCKKCGSPLVSQVLPPIKEEPKVAPSLAVRREEPKIPQGQRSVVVGIYRQLHPIT